MDNIPSEILKEELDKEIREWNEMKYGVPVLERVAERLDEFLEDAQVCRSLTESGIFLSIQVIKEEINKLEGKQCKKILLS